MYSESVEWYYNRYINKKYDAECEFHCNTENSILETQNPGDGRRYWLSIENQKVSPVFKAREMKIWLDAITEQYL